MKTVKVLKIRPTYARPKTIAHSYCFNLSYVLRIINEMRKSKKWRDSVVSYNHKTIVNLADFEKFQQEKVREVRCKNEKNDR